MSVPKNQHGVGGAYVGGDWVNIEDCDKLFNIKNGSSRGACGGDCSVCPRSRSHGSAAKSDGSYDVVIIGAGCIGSAIARELSKTKTSVLLLESADDVTQGATKGNSGIVHAGFDDQPGSVRSRFCWKGNQMYVFLSHLIVFLMQSTAKGFPSWTGSCTSATRETAVLLSHLATRTKSTFWS